jgi:hypothetical protein
VPAGWLAPSTQVIAPVLQEVMPTLQTLGLELHDAPAVQATQLPPLLQTKSVPQAVPGALLPPSTQVMTPVAQDVVPFRQTPGLPVHALPAVHAPQAPLPLQTMLVPQAVPGALLPPSTQVIAPVAQEVVPLRQMLGLVVHALPAVQAPQVPLPLQTMLVPQPVPGALLPPSMQAITPVAQEVVPLRQMLGLVVHAVPAVQPPQTPVALQTRFVPQLVPAALLPPSMQVNTPVVQDVMPFRQMLGLVVHAVFAAQGPQVPLLQTMFVPHVVPLATFPVSAQTGTPVTHEFVPVLHGFAGWQPAPAVQGPQVPLLQTMFVPHVVPLARFLFVSEQAIAGAQVCVPAWHGLVGVQARPAVHDTQLPLLHTRFVPQVVPLATFPDAVQTGAPVVHDVVPVLHGMPVTVQLAPTVQAPQTPVALQTRFVPQPVPAGTFTFRSVQTGVPVVQASIPR